MLEIHVSHNIPVNTPRRNVLREIRTTVLFFLLFPAWCQILSAPLFLPSEGLRLYREENSVPRWGFPPPFFSLTMTHFPSEASSFQVTMHGIETVTKCREI